LGRALSLEVVAEGVETAEQLAFLREHRCDEMQGFYFSRPVPATDMGRLLRDHRLKAEVAPSASAHQPLSHPLNSPFAH
ncbi:MAG TPA: EAL domain-containing protein, partial [Rubrivivax sp.]|nr:EAL domain-containing protein [Rubrivivax sp.]